jgi:dynein light chain Tctex-type 1
MPTDQIFEFNKIKEEVIGTVDNVLKSTLESKKYNSAKSAEWIDKISTSLLGYLKDISSNFKFIVSTVILQKTGAGLHSEISSYWDASTDGAIVTKFENETMICICTVIGVGI